MNQKYILYSILGFWILILIGMFVFHFSIPPRILFLIGTVAIAYTGYISISYLIKIKKNQNLINDVTDDVNNENKVVENNDSVDKI